MENSANEFRVERKLYYITKFLSQTSQNIWLAALFLAAGTGGRPALDLASLFLAMLLPSIVLALPGGWLADRMGPARGLVLGGTFRFSAVAAGIILLDGGTSAWLLAFFYSAGSQVFSPSEWALARPLQASRAGAVHSWLVALQYGGQGVGMLILAPALYYLGGPTAMVTGSALGFAALTGIGTVLAKRMARHIDPARPREENTILGFGETLRFFKNSPLARLGVATLGIKMMVSKGIVVALPFYLESDLGLGLGALAYLAIPGIAGVILGLLWCSRTLNAERAHGVMVMSIIGLAVSLTALAALDYGVTAVAQYSQIPPVIDLEARMNTSFVVAMPAAFLIGLCLSGALISARVALTETAPAGQQGRVFAVQLIVTELLIALPLMSLGIGTTVAGARTTLASLAALLIIILAVLELDARRRQPRPSLPAFEPALEPVPVEVSR